jgi:hypothetical protein
MSEQEFDLYLKLLAKCLHLTSGQREQIADELRDHLESRLEELGRAGVPREKAVVQALDEFGDAAVLAAHFTTIARLKRRRFLMRLSLGSVGALTAALLIAFAFWPDNRALRGPEKIVAQEKPKAPVPEATKRTPAAQSGSTVKAPETPSDRDEIVKLKRECYRLQGYIANLQKINQGLRSKVDHPEKEIANLREQVKTLQDELQRLAVEAKARPLSSDVFQGSKVEARIAEALSQPVDFEMQQQPLQEALEFIAARYQIPIILDRKGMHDVNFDPKKENVQLAVSGIPLRDMLGLLLDQTNSALGYEFRHGVLSVSTIDKIKEHTEIVVYDCRDLVDANTPDPSPAVVQSVDPGDAMLQLSAEPTKAARKSGAHSGNSTNRQSKVPETTASVAPRKAAQLINMLRNATGSDLWDDEQAKITYFDGLLVVRQNPLVQEQIRCALADIRQMRVRGAFASLGNQCDGEATKRVGKSPQPQSKVPTPAPGKQRATGL